MFSNLTKISQAVEKKEDLKKLRVMLISTIISYPLWGLLSKHMAPLAYDPIWQRILCSVISAFVLIISFRIKNPLKYKTWFNLVAWLYSYHLLFLYWKNPDTAYYAICNLIQFPYVILCFPTKKSAQIYTYSKFFAISIFAFFLTYKNINPWFFVLSMVTIGHYVMTVLINHFNVVDSLKKAEIEFDLALSNMLEGVIIMDSKGLFNSYNNTASNLLSFSEDSHVGKSFKDTSLYKNCVKENYDLYSDGDHPFIQAIESINPAKNIVMGIENEKEQRRWLLFNIQPLNNSENILISFSDISIIKNNQETKVAQQAQMAMNARLSSLFAVAGGVAHEINNPLGIIIARLQNLDKKIDHNHYDKEVFKNTIFKTINTAYRISKIVTTLMSLSKRADDLPKEIVKLSDILGETLTLCRENFKISAIELLIEEIPEVYINCRSIQISQVFHNILTNAYDSTFDHEKRWVKITFTNNEKNIVVTISDSGPEISKDIKIKMMHPFFTTKDVGKGAGLGLSVSRAIIEEHNGSLYVDLDSSITCLNIMLQKENYSHP